MQSLSVRLRQAAEMLAAMLFAGTLDGCRPTRSTDLPGACTDSNDCVRAHGAGWYCDPGPPRFCRPPEGPLAGPPQQIPSVYGPPPRAVQPPLDPDPLQPMPAYGVRPAPPPTHYGPRPFVRRTPGGSSPRLYGPLAVDECV